MGPILKSKSEAGVAARPRTSCTDDDAGRAGASPRLITLCQIRARRPPLGHVVASPSPESVNGSVSDRGELLVMTLDPPVRSEKVLGTDPPPPLPTPFVRKGNRTHREGDDIGSCPLSARLGSTCLSIENQHSVIQKCRTTPINLRDLVPQ